MSAYLVNVYTFYPYKIEFTYTEKASNHAVAIARAVRKFRKEEKITGRKIKEVTAKATRLNGV